MKRASIIGCEQTFAQFKDAVLAKRRPSAASLALVGAVACGDAALLVLGVSPRSPASLRGNLKWVMCRAV